MIQILKDSFLPFNSTSEGKIFFRNVILMSCILINVNIVRIIKDSYVTTMLGAETISFCKLLGELPFSIFFFFIYSKLSNIMNTEKLCRYTMFSFLITLALLPFLFFQFNSYVTLSEENKKSIQEAYPALKWIVATFSNWPYVIYFILGEIWPIIAYSVLFWQFMNKFNDPVESERHYISYNLYGQTSLLFSGIIVNFFISNQTYLNILVQVFLFPVNENDQKVKVLSTIVLFLGLIAIMLHYICEQYYKNAKTNSSLKSKDSKKDKFHLTIKESISLLVKSKQIRDIVFIIFGYGFTVTLMHLTWLSALQHKYPSPIEFMQFQAYLNYWTGILTIIIAIFGKKIVKVFGLSFAAKVTPVFTLIPGAIFYAACTVFNYSLNLTIISYATLIGSIQYVLVRASKYVLFDSTKERLYTFIDNEELKTKGKVLADVLGFKMGKAMGAFALAAPLIISPSQNYITIAPFTGIALVLVCYFWIKAISDSTKTVSK
jgi:ATP/ADP translocase